MLFKWSRQMIKVLLTAILFAIAFTIIAIVIAVFVSLTEFEISEETEEILTKLCGVSLAISGICWIIAFLLGFGILLVKIWL